VAPAVLIGLAPILNAQTNGLQKINHVVVIYQENWSFDSLYGRFPGANGIDSAGAAARQVDKDGNLYTTLPQPLNTTFSPAIPDSRPTCRTRPSEMSKYVSPTQQSGDLVQRYYQEQYQIDGGKMDKFVAWTDSAGLVMSYYDGTNMPEGKLAQQYTLLDNFFHAAFGGSFLNHQFLVWACAPRWPDAPASVVAQLDANGSMTKTARSRRTGTPSTRPTRSTRLTRRRSPTRTCSSGTNRADHRRPAQ